MWVRNCNLRDENKVKGFENEKLKILFRSARKLKKRDWRNVSIEKVHNFYISLSDCGTGTSQKLQFGVNTVIELKYMKLTSDMINTFLRQNLPR